MAEHFDPNQPDEPQNRPEDQPVEFEPMEVEQPRRAASAQLEVESELTAEASLREAMDPANQSLAEALRLCYRVLQLVMVILVVLFLVSGVKTVQEGQSGVLTVFGKITPIDGSESLEPGLKFSVWPYPAGEFVIFPARNRTVNDNHQFVTSDARTLSFEQATNRAQMSDNLRPGQDGYLLTANYEIGHARISAQYDIVNPAQMIRSMSESEADRIVQLAVQRAAVHQAAGNDLERLTENTDEVRPLIRQSAQAMLDRIASGIEIVDLNIDAVEALPVRRVVNELASARSEIDTAVQRAREEADRTLINTVGSDYEQAKRLVEQYEQAYDSDNPAAAEQYLDELFAFLESEKVSGEISQIIGFADTFEAQVRSTLGNEAQRFMSLLPAYRKHPRLVVHQEWLNTYKKVISREQTEVMYVPDAISQVDIQISGSEEIQKKRRRHEREQAEQQVLQSFIGDNAGPYILRARDMITEGPGRRLRVEDGEVRAPKERDQ